MSNRAIDHSKAQCVPGIVKIGLRLRVFVASYRSTGGPLLRTGRREGSKRELCGWVHENQGNGKGGAPD